MEQNPYALSQVSPASQCENHNTSDGIVITPNALAAVIGTQFWVKFMGILMFIMVVIQALAALFDLSETPQDLAASPLFDYVIPIVTMVIYTILAVHLMQYGSAISALAKTRDTVNFDRAMEVQTKYWKLLGILSMIILALIAFAIIKEITSSPYYR